jgi:hypothetical protein
MTPQEFLTHQLKTQTMREIADKTKLAERNLWRIKTGEVRNPRLYTIDRIFSAYGLDRSNCILPGSPPEPFLVDRPRINRLSSAFRVAIWRSLQNGVDVIRGFSGRPVRTLRSKITSSTPDEDPTHPIDAETSKAIRQTLERLCNYEDFADGFHLITEEEGYIDRYVASGADPDLVLFEDSTDDTSKAERGLGGTSLISAYQLGVGWIATAIGDLSRHNLYWRVGNTERDRSVAMHLNLVQDEGLVPPSRDFKEPRGYAFAVSPNDTTDLTGAAVNIYTGHTPRLLSTVQMGQNLINTLGRMALT